MKDEMNKAQSGERTFDENQKKAITVSRNAVVSAGAGSGKTTVLAERFSYLVTEKHYNADQILTLTFTKKATVEMSDRIYKVLKKKAPEQAAQFFKANIKTLDSYCNSVAKTGAHLYGISPDFTQDDETISEQVYNMALPFILEHRDNFAVKTLVKTDSFDKIAKELFVQPVLENSTISSPVDFDACIQKQHEEILCAWKENAAHADKTVNALLNSFNQFDGNKGTQTYKTLYDVLGNPESFPEVPPLYIEDIQKSDSAKIERYALFINRLEKLPLPRGKGVEEIKDCLNELRAVSPVLISLVNYVSGFYITKELIPLLKEFQDKVNNLKRAGSILTFRDVSSLAMCILRDHPDLRKIEKEKYKAIMIDEFQDNNAMQRDMLFLLAERPE
ncbi:MAG: UvrD-helicase domain-containing protein, partial [Treponema porcinum]|nr:UvrD-helicase domain-containing protein [Treponema porcinum]